MMAEQKHMTDRFASTLVIAASIIAAVRLAREQDINRPSPRLTSVVSDSIGLARMILERIVRWCGTKCSRLCDATTTSTRASVRNYASEAIGLSCAEMDPLAACFTACNLWPDLFRRLLLNLGAKKGIDCVFGMPTARQFALSSTVKRISDSPVSVSSLMFSSFRQCDV